MNIKNIFVKIYMEKLCTRKLTLETRPQLAASLADMGSPVRFISMALG